MKYRCPTCGFHIFNRRLDKCESCHAEIPAHLLFSPDEIDKLDQQYEQSRKERALRQGKPLEPRREYGAGDVGGGWIDGSGDGGCE